jgi:hypothetical protein
MSCAIGQTVERHVAAKTEVLGARRADRPAASLLAEFNSEQGRSLAIGASQTGCPLV